ncbi:MAG: transferase [Desulfovibrio sp.]
MNKLNALTDHIIGRVNINLRKPTVDVAPYVKGCIQQDNLAQYYAFYALTTDHPMSFAFNNSSLAGTYFLGKCSVDHSILYKADIRGDELKSKGTVVTVGDEKIETFADEVIDIRHSFLVKTLVHNCSHDPENLEKFKILNTVALHYSNIHGTPVEGCLLEPFSTVDLSICHDCRIGTYSYVQAGELSHEHIEPGRIWIKADGLFEFNYTYPEGVIEKYISMDNDVNPQGIFMDFFNERKEDFMPVYCSVQPDVVEHPESAFVSPYSVIKGNCKIGENVLIAQRAYVEDSEMGEGANAQENCYIINSIYEGRDVTAHGGKVINCHLGEQVFVGFNSFLRGLPDSRIKIGAGSIVMPHTIMDAESPIEIPENTLVWGYITSQEDLEMNSVSLNEIRKVKAFELGNMTFQGVGEKFLRAFKGRIEHILEENGAFFDGTEETRGHAQKTQNVSYNLLQPYQQGGLLGMCPTMKIEGLPNGE